jgi:hypothetical protein
MLRRLLSLLLCVCLSLQGAGLALASEPACPMEAAMQDMVSAGELDPADLSDCCNDLQTWAETGQLCKSSVDCQGLMTWAPAPGAMVVARAPASDPPWAPSTATFAAPTGAPWRPPTAG